MIYKSPKGGLCTRAPLQDGKVTGDQVVDALARELAGARDMIQHLAMNSDHQGLWLARQEGTVLQRCLFLTFVVQSMEKVLEEAWI